MVYLPEQNMAPLLYKLCQNQPLTISNIVLQTKKKKKISNRGSYNSAQVFSFLNNESTETQVSRVEIEESRLEQ